MGGVYGGRGGRGCVTGGNNVPSNERTACNATGRMRCGPLSVWKAEGKVFGVRAECQVAGRRAAN